MIFSCLVFTYDSCIQKFERKNYTESEKTSDVLDIKVNFHTTLYGILSTKVLKDEFYLNRKEYCWILFTAVDR